MNVNAFLKQVGNVSKTCLIDLFLWGAFAGLQEDRDARLAQAQTDIEMLRGELEKARERTKADRETGAQAAFDMGAQFAALSEKFLEERTARDDAELRLCRVRKMAMVAWFYGTPIQPELLRDLIS